MQGASLKGGHTMHLNGIFLGLYGIYASLSDQKDVKMWISNHH